MPFMDFPVGIQTAWCVDDFTLENGATTLVPGSHAERAIPKNGASIQVIALAGSVIAFDCQAWHAGGANQSQAVRRAVLPLYIRSWLKPQTEHKRSFPRPMWGDALPALLRLMGFRRQSPEEYPAGRSEIIQAPGATAFYEWENEKPTRY